MRMPFCGRRRARRGVLTKQEDQDADPGGQDDASGQARDGGAERVRGGLGQEHVGQQRGDESLQHEH